MSPPDAESSAEARGVALSADGRAHIHTGMLALPPADVRGGLEHQLKHAGVQEFSQRNFSVDSIRRFRPAPEAYHFVANELDVAPAGLRLIAAHAWDVVGALRAGCAAAFVARPGKVLYPLAPKPDIIGADVRAVAAQIVERVS